MLREDWEHHPMPARRSHPWLAEALYALDAGLRRRNAVLEFTAYSSCVFRLQIARSSHAFVLHDGTQLRRGDRVVQLHFWNEHIPPLPRHGATIGWARRMQRLITQSLHELAIYIAARPELADIAVIWADVACATCEQRRQLAAIMAHYGFQAIAEPERLPIAEQVHRFGENILISLMVFAQNGGALRLDSLRRVRVPIFISRRALEQRFGG